MEISVNCNNCFGEFDQAISAVNFRGLANIEGYTLTIYRLTLIDKSEVLQFCDRDTDNHICRIKYISEKVDRRNLFWNYYEISQEDGLKLASWLQSRWRCVAGKPEFAEAFNTDTEISVDLFAGEEK